MAELVTKVKLVNETTWICMTLIFLQKLRGHTYIFTLKPEK